MSDSPVTVTPLARYRNDAPYPFCPGCGHGGILDALNAALGKLQLDPSTTVIVSDIGCVGLSDQYFDVNAFHGLHGRSIAYATGIKLARPDFKVIVVIGDGGCGIGGSHLLNAARRNIGLTVLVFNNLNFGMTGGQHSVTTPEGGVTATTKNGNLERPLDLCGTVAVNGASYAYRGTVFDKDLPDRIAEAIRVEGLALLDIWELCTAYYAPSNAFSRKQLFETLERFGFKQGLVHRESRPEYAAACREGAGAPARARSARAVEPRFASGLEERLGLVVAGTAGGKVRSAARLVGHAAVLSGLRAAQRDDYPVTVKTGHSVSELILSPNAIEYTGIADPRALVIVSPEGLGKCGRYLTSMGKQGRVYTLPGLTLPRTAAQVAVLEGSGGVTFNRKTAALVALVAAVTQLRVLSAEALLAAAREDVPAYAEENVKAIEAGLALARTAHA